MAVDSSHSNLFTDLQDFVLHNRLLAFAHQQYKVLVLLSNNLSIFHLYLETAIVAVRPNCRIEEFKFMKTFTLV